MAGKGRHRRTSPVHHEHLRTRYLVIGKFKDTICFTFRLIYLQQIPRERLALDVVRLEWAHVEAFDGGCLPNLTPADVEAAGLELRVSLHPHIRLLDLTYPVDDLLIEVHDHEDDGNTSSNAAHEGQLRSRVRPYARPEPERIFLGVHRMQDAVYYKRLQPESFLMLKALGNQQSIEESIEIAFENSSMPEEERTIAITSWFGNWAELGWFCRPRAVTS
jgi:hypothetical protein